MRRCSSARTVAKCPSSRARSDSTTGRTCRTHRLHVVAIAMIIAFMAMLGGCIQKPLLPFTTDVPPMLLAPVGTADAVTDRRGRFRQILCAVTADHGRQLPDFRPCDETLWRLTGEREEPDAPVYLGPARLPLRIMFVGGLASECAANYVPTLPLAAQHLERLGYKVNDLAVSGLGSTTFNGQQIAHDILAADLKVDERLVMVGYSKGLPDILEAVVMSPLAASKVTAIVGIAGAVNGSPLAEEASKELFPLLQYLPGSICRLGDNGGLDSLRRDRRTAWLANHTLPDSVRYYSLAAFVHRDQASLALRGGWDRLSQIDPRNDGQLLFYDQIIPGSDLLGFAIADHWGIAMPLNRIYPTLSGAFANRNAYPRELVLEAIVRLIEDDLLAERRS